MFRRHGRVVGASLATVMMVVAMMLTLAFTVVAIAFHHLNLSNKNANASRAKHLAEATLAKTIDALVNDQEFGTIGSAEDRTVRVTFDTLPAGSEGILTFDQSLASSEGVPYSTNNRSESSVEGVDLKLVPGESFHLVAMGKVKNSTSRVEAVITVPKFPFSVAAEGSIVSNGGLVVASVKPGVPYDLRYPIHDEDLEPGHLVTNSKVGDGAVVLSGENKIYGDIQSSSGVTIEEDTSILGEIRRNALDESLPQLNASNYDPELEAGLATVNSGAGELEVEGYNKSYGDLTVDNGIVLNGGVLFVDGDLTVSAGGVKGKGALISTGDITVFGDGEATSDNQAALVADGDITLMGSSSEKASFAGLIYTRGKLQAENLRLAGVFVAAGDDSDVEFENTEVYEDLRHAKIELSSTTESAPFEFPTFSAPNYAFDGKPLVSTYDVGAFESNLEDFRNTNTGSGEPEYLFKFANAGSSTGYFTHQYDSSGANLVETAGPDAFVVNGATLGLQLFGQTITSEAQAESVAVAELEAQFAAEGRTLTEAEKNSIRASARLLFNPSYSFFLSQASANHSHSNSGGSTSTGGGSTSFEWTLDLSEFYNRSDHMKVLYWADYTDA